MTNKFHHMLLLLIWRNVDAINLFAKLFQTVRPFLCFSAWSLATRLLLISIVFCEMPLAAASWCVSPMSLRNSHKICSLAQLLCTFALWNSSVLCAVAVQHPQIYKPPCHSFSNGPGSFRQSLLHFLQPNGPRSAFRVAKNACKIKTKTILECNNGSKTIMKQNQLAISVNNKLLDLQFIFAANWAVDTHELESTQQGWLFQLQGGCKGYLKVPYCNSLVEVLEVLCRSSHDKDF